MVGVLKQHGFGSDGGRQETTMERQHFTRRIVLGAGVVALAVLAALGGGDEVNAERVNQKTTDYGSKAAFKKDCEEGGSATPSSTPRTTT